LIKAVGAVNTIGNTDKQRRANQLRFLLRLLRGMAFEMAKLGSEGVVIEKIYATSETGAGIAMAFSAKMEQFGKPLAVGRFRFVSDVETSALSLIQPYKRSLAKWRKTTTNEKS
jgi:hypothetical protein